MINDICAMCMIVDSNNSISYYLHETINDKCVGN